jgi:hypothetical protein
VAISLGEERRVDISMHCRATSVRTSARLLFPGGVASAHLRGSKQMEQGTQMWAFVVMHTSPGLAQVFGFPDLHVQRQPAHRLAPRLESKAARHVTRGDPRT